MCLNPTKTMAQIEWRIKEYLNYQTKFVFDQFNVNIKLVFPIKYLYCVLLHIDLSKKMRFY